MPADADPELDYLEALFGAAYRREMEQEENFWRSLPFFAATLALQLAGLAQIRDWVGAASAWMFWLSLSLLTAAALATLGALIFLTESIWPAGYYVATDEAALRDYVAGVRTDAILTGSTREEAAATGAAAAKSLMVVQYAVGCVHNRKINRHRLECRTRAGLCTLASVFMVLVLVAMVLVANLHGHG